MKKWLQQVIDKLKVKKEVPWDTLELPGWEPRYMPKQLFEPGRPLYCERCYDLITSQDPGYNLRPYDDVRRTAFVHIRCEHPDDKSLTWNPDLEGGYPQQYLDYLRDNEQNSNE